MGKILYIIGKKTKINSGGPASIIEGLIDNFRKENINFKAIILKDDDNKAKFIARIFWTCLKAERQIINVHTDGLLIPFLVYIFSILFPHNSYYLTVHGIYSYEASMGGKVKKKYLVIEKILYTKFQNLICVSEMLKDNIKESYGRNDNVYVIPNATSATSIKKPCSKEKIQLIFLGGLRLRKGIDYLLQVCTRLEQKKINYSLNIYGQADNNEKWFYDELSRLHLNTNVFYKGLLRDKQKLYDLLAESDIQLCLSRYDTYNVAIAESLVLGCPVIATNKCGAANLVEKDAGCIVNVEDWKNQGLIQTCSYIEKIYQNRSIRNEVFVSKNYYVDKLGWKSIVKMYASLV